VLASPSLDSWVRARKAGRAACVVADGTADAWTTVAEVLARLEPTPTVVALEWPEPPRLSEELSQALHALGQAALDLWPALYLSAGERLGAAEGKSEAEEVLPQQPWTRYPEVASRWRQRAQAACRRGRLPVFTREPLSDQLRQLGLAIDPRTLVLAIRVVGGPAGSERLMSLSRGAEWLATQSAAVVLVLLPDAWKGDPGLDAISYDSFTVSRPSIEPEHEASPPPNVSVEPLLGRPHPRSAAEAELYQRISRDQDLCQLFGFNRPVKSVRGSNFIADVLWEAGALVVEVDGHADHSRRERFVQDRNRDYELMLSGYHVLRLPADEVLQDPSISVDKIRDVVRFLRNTQRSP
jgi:very-short-patch-repair endonuclease